jgi:hypothetical protein
VYPGGIPIEAAALVSGEDQNWTFTMGKPRSRPGVDPTAWSAANSGVAANGGNNEGAGAVGSAAAPPPPAPADPQQRGLVMEVEVLARCCHPNIVRLLAACLK